MQGVSLAEKPLRSAVLNGLLVTLAAIGVIEFVLSIPTLTGVLAVVAYVAWRWEQPAGLVSTVIVSLYGVHYFSNPGFPFAYTADNAVRLVSLPGTALVVAWIVGNLRTRVQASEERLRQQHDFQRAIDNSLAEGVYALDQAGRVTFMNPAAERLLGWTAAEVQGRIMHDVIHVQHVDDSPLPWQECRGLQKVLSTGVIHRTDDDVFTRKDDTLLPVAYSAAPIVMNGAISGVAVAFHDITERKRAEQERALLASIVHSADEAIISVTRDGTILSWNPGAEKLYGYTAEEVRGRDISILLPVEIRNESMNLLDRIVRDGVYGRVETRRVCKDGRMIDVSLTLSLIKDAAGQITGVSAIARDITKRKRAEEALRESEERFRSAFAESAVGHAVVAPDGQFMQVNRAYCTITGYTEAELLATTFQAITHPGDLEANLAQVSQLLAGEISHFHMEKRYVRKDGRLVPVVVDTAVVRDAAGNPLYLSTVVQDITERRRAEEELQVRARQQAAVAELGLRALGMSDLGQLIDEALVLVVQTLDIEYSKFLELLPGAQQLLLRAGVGYQEGNVGHIIVGTGTNSQAGYTLRTSGPVVVEDLRTETRFRVAPFVQDHRIISTMSVVIHGHERPFGVLQVDSPRLRHFSEDDIHFLQAIANVLSAALERKRVEEMTRSIRDEAERLEELERLRHEFISSISHDLRTPLTAARTGLGMLEMRVTERLRADEQMLLDNARRNIERLRLLIDDLLAYNQIEAGVLQLERLPLDLRTVVADAVTAVYPLIQKKGQTLEINLAEPLLTEGDAWRLGQVLINLLANANEHTPAGTDITITGHQEAERVILSISDTGQGIPAEALDTIFQRFQRLDGAKGGAGLGLAIVKGIVELHGGVIRVESELGQGTSFSIALPVDRDGGAA